MTHAPTFAFGDYLFIPRRQLLLKRGQPVRIGCRALDLLAAFVQRPGEVLSKRELLEEAWPSTVVVEANLKVHVAALRRALHDDADIAKYIATVNGRGYRFVAPVEAADATRSLGGVSRSGREVQPVPAFPLTARPDGRFEDLVALLAQTMRSSVVDPPGEAEVSAIASPPRRLLLIELTARDEAWIETMITQRRHAIFAPP